jgi:hypothetical protein
MADSSAGVGVEGPFSGLGESVGSSRGRWETGMVRGWGCGGLGTEVGGVDGWVVRVGVRIVTVVVARGGWGVQRG